LTLKRGTGAHKGLGVSDARYQKAARESDCGNNQRKDSFARKKQFVAHGNLPCFNALCAYFENVADALFSLGLILMDLY
jgi:hypothetical protein